jgi:hypothetical protein
MLDFYHHDIGGGVHKLGREAGWRFEKRASYGPSAVSNAENLHVNSGA